jgi:murein DD-endopeptidase MepM/ murein hydrolase activator NlpD
MNKRILVHSVVEEIARCIRTGLLCLFLAGSWISPLGRAVAQDEEPEGPVYVVQEGDTLWGIAQRFGVSWEDLAQENGISDPGQLAAGVELVIPGLQGVEGRLTTIRVPFGENFRSLIRRYQVPAEAMIRLNHVTSLGELYIGGNIIVPQDGLEAAPGERVALAAGESLLELAAARGENPWALARRNGLAGGWEAMPGDIYFAPGSEAEGGPGALPGSIRAAELEPTILTQGETAVVRLEAGLLLNVRGSLLDYDLHFFRTDAGDYVALQGIHAMETPGVYSVRIDGELENGTRFGFSQRVRVTAGDFGFYSLTVPPDTIDPTNTKPEDEIWNAIPLEFTGEKLWKGKFLRPVAPSDCGFTDFFGSRRSYNGSPYNYFHSGLDYCYNYNLDVNEIYAVADGVVVFADELIVRGKATMIDHGWGVYTAYMHQEEILVKEGDRVKAGQVIGIVGGTGRVNGPHLHLEVWVGGVQVDPMDWLEKVFP